MFDLELHDVPGPEAGYRARKLARIFIDLDRRTARFHGFGDGVLSGAEGDLAYGTSPGEFCGEDTCTCGFHGSRRAETLLDLLSPTLAELSGSALLDVELHGEMGASNFGARAAGQRILGAQLFRWCANCVVEETAEAGPVALFAVPTDSSPSAFRSLAALCTDHAAHGGVASVTLADAAGWLGVEVTWASAAISEDVRGRIEQTWAPPQATGPLAGERRVADLRMGQVAFVRPSAIRTDEAGRLWVDANASAPQRPSDASSVPVKRDVDLQLELVATSDEVSRWDARWSRPRPVAPGTAEARVARIRGIRRLPRLGAVWTG